MDYLPWRSTSLAERPITDPDHDDRSEFKSNGKLKRWSVILGRMYKPFYYSTRTEAFNVIADAFKATYNTPDDREVGEIYQRWNNERRMVEMYYNIGGIPQPNPEVNDPNLSWMERKLFEIPSRPRNSVFHFIVTWLQSGFPISKKFDFAAFNYEIARGQVDAAMERILRAAKALNTDYHVDYRGASR